ncbi:response regulator [Oleiagrimonas sp. C23AA]|uniref:response regulator n=1 Tax=Oleiagrimonas sp. C23AA TaxID=2719047 RepID=UPI00141D8C4D|nr:response regulator [Oleiagrimonas sp. C23AA]NII11186.1 response regulator [Oleiagrimonas sp. C23AA]
MRILIAEDEPKTHRYLAQGLKEHGHVVEVAGDGIAALKLARARLFDVIILDVMLPGMDGWEVITALRSNGLATPVLFLTARDHVEDRVRGFELGANDYLIKPFAFAELLARLNNMARPQGHEGASLISIGDLRLDPLRHHVELAGRTIHMTSKEYALLMLLARRHARVVSRTLIADVVWGLDGEVSNNAVDALVRRVRSKIEPGAGGSLVHTVRGVGYILDWRERDGPHQGDES